MKIEIFGTGCAKCGTLEKYVKDAVKELNIPADVVKVSDINEMVRRGVMLTPALFVNGRKKSEGKLPQYDDVRKLIKEAE